MWNSSRFWLTHFCKSFLDGIGLTEVDWRRWKVSTRLARLYFVEQRPGCSGPELLFSLPLGPQSADSLIQRVEEVEADITRRRKGRKLLTGAGSALEEWKVLLLERRKLSIELLNLFSRVFAETRGHIRAMMTDDNNDDHAGRRRPGVVVGKLGAQE